jgi:hypothetical protein
MVSREQDSEIWSEYIRIKHELMDYDCNLREAIGNIRIRMRMNNGKSKQTELFAKAQKHVGMILDLGLSSGAIPSDSPQEQIEFAEKVSKGQWMGVEDFEKCQLFFRNSYMKTKFYSVTREKPKMLAPHEV